MLGAEDRAKTARKTADCPQANVSADLGQGAAESTRVPEGRWPPASGTVGSLPAERSRPSAKVPILGRGNIPAALPRNCRRRRCFFLWPVSPLQSKRRQPVRRLFGSPISARMSQTGTQMAMHHVPRPLFRGSHTPRSLPGCPQPAMQAVWGPLRTVSWKPVHQCRIDRTPQSSKAALPDRVTHPPTGDFVKRGIGSFRRRSWSVSPQRSLRVDVLSTVLGVSPPATGSRCSLAAC